MVGLESSFPLVDRWSGTKSVRGSSEITTAAA